MVQNQLRDFFREKKEKAKAINIDWAAKRDAWINAVEDFYRTITGDVTAAAPDVKLTRADRVVTENHIGEYHIDDLVLRLGDEEVVFSPKGTNVVGAKGRIDVRGDRGEENIVWQEDGRWSIVMSRTPLRLIPLTPDSLAEILRLVMRP